MLLALGLTACGGADDAGLEPEATAGTASAQTLPSQSGDSARTSAPASSATTSTAVTVTAVDFELQTDQDSFLAGDYTIEFVNEGSSTHDLTVERNGERIDAAEAVDPGQTSTFTVTLEPGRYLFYCSVANHRAMGMELMIEVT